VIVWCEFLNPLSGDGVVDLVRFLKLAFGMAVDDERRFSYEAKVKEGQLAKETAKAER